MELLIFAKMNDFKMGISIDSICFLLLAIFCIQGLNYHPVAAISTISPGDQLNSNSTLVSDGGNFTLGFFIKKPTNVSYLGIWHTASDGERKAWVANPNTPMIIGVGILTIDSTGILKVVSGGITLFNISDQVGSGSTRAVLTDSGNFVLMDAADNRTLWQSFDHPASALLPGMKLGFNLTTRQNWTLTSWLGDESPGSGAFTLRLEQFQGLAQLVLYSRGKLYWSSGPWSNQGFQNLPALSNTSNRFRHNLSFISDRDGMYFSFQTIGASFSMLQLLPGGQIYDVANRGPASPYANFCYGYQSDDGCATSPFPSCRGNNDRFDGVSGEFRGQRGNVINNSSLSLRDCEEICWNDCNCVGFNTTSNGTGCITWTRGADFQVDLSGTTVTKYVLVSRQSSRNRKWIWIIVSVAILVVLLLAGFLCYLRIKRRRLAEEEKKVRDGYIHQLIASDSFVNADAVEKNGRDGSDLNIFSFGSIVAATNNFSSENKLGEGGFGPVYKGKLPDGREIAIKRLSSTSGQGLVELKNELILISKLQHTNLVRVLGCCIHEEEKMLIYEYMPNKSLDFFLFAQDKRERLDWPMRFNIIEGVAQGLLYLHKYSRMRVIHRDLKASNVLLDENMNPKIADFGMARIFKQNETEAMTNRVVGTLGYMSPEYAMDGTFSIKSDVFSFGVLILEVTSGRKNSTLYHLDCRLNLVEYVWELWKGGTALELKDPALGDSCDIKQLLRTIHVGLLCVQENATDRPTISEVISMLNNETMSLPAPKPPPIFSGREELEIPSSESKSSEPSENNLPISVDYLPISVVEAR